MLDTRSGLGGAAAKIPANGSVTFQIAGVAGVPSGATAVALTIQANAPSAYGWLNLFPSDQPTTVSSLTYHENEATAGADIVRLTSTGKLTIRNNGAGAEAHAIITVRGYFADTAIASSGQTYHPTTSTLLYDTRTGAGTPPQTTPIPGNGGFVVFDVAGAEGVPESGVSAVAVTVVATQHTAKGWLTVVPSDQNPGSGGLTYVADESNSTMMISQLSATGDLKITNHGTGPVHVTLSMRGYFTLDTDDNQGTPYTPVATTTIYDTVSDIGGGGTLPLAPTETVTFTVAGIAGLGYDDASAAALILNARQATRNGWLSAYPADKPDPGVSSVDFAPAESTNGLDFVRPDAEGRIKVTNHSDGPVHLTVAVQGYYVDVDDPSSTPDTPGEIIEEGEEDVPLSTGGTVRLSYVDKTKFARGNCTGLKDGWVKITYRKYSAGTVKLRWAEAHTKDDWWAGEKFQVAWRGNDGDSTYWRATRPYAGRFSWNDHAITDRYPNIRYHKPYVKYSAEWDLLRTTRRCKAYITMN
ncbi:hypothetical protein [Nonomuraea endophytica]|uniref:Uncharacterized protein n=1 Tax=Nonomuraea endophytica TaxID=714136 RepID=A0A7W8ABH7_9ACTN|nr:hypothetical protein [Nonomuraea endophytica]MBB5083174.1 hypothetical protein [Nonomuraea endophytica]